MVLTHRHRRRWRCRANHPPAPAARRRAEAAGLVPRLDRKVRVGWKCLRRVAHLVGGGGRDIYTSAGPRCRPSIGLLHRIGNSLAGWRDVEPLPQGPARRQRNALLAVRHAKRIGSGPVGVIKPAESRKLRVPTAERHASPAEQAEQASGARTNCRARRTEYRADPGARSSAAEAALQQ